MFNSIFFFHVNEALRLNSKGLDIGLTALLLSAAGNQEFA
jgi:hypothetical protein